MDIGNDIRQAVTKYSDMLYRICIVILCNEQDVQDAIQDTFCRYLEKAPDFHDEEHEKAWLIRVATNICRDMVRFRLRHPKVCRICSLARHSRIFTAPSVMPRISAISFIWYPST